MAMWTSWYWNDLEDALYKGEKKFEFLKSCINY